MNIEELEAVCGKAEEESSRMAANGFAYCEPVIHLVVPGACRGERKRVLPGVLGRVINERSTPRGVECTVAVKCKDVRRAVAKHRKGARR